MNLNSKPEWKLTCDYKFSGFLFFPFSPELDVEADKFPYFFVSSSDSFKKFLVVGLSLR